MGAGVLRFYDVNEAVPIGEGLPYDVRETGVLEHPPVVLLCVCLAALCSFLNMVCLARINARVE
jgi:hypothetical protein